MIEIMPIRWPKHAAIQLVVFIIVIALYIFCHLFGSDGHMELSL